jgi:hypothetical protein
MRFIDAEGVGWAAHDAVVTQQLTHSPNYGSRNASARDSHTLLRERFAVPINDGASLP